MNATAPGRPSHPIDDLVDSLMATGRYGSRDEVVRVALQELLHKPPASGTEPRHDAEEALRESEGRLRLAVEAGRLAVWEVHVATGAVLPSPELNEILGFPRDASPSIDEYRAGYLPGEQQRVQAAGAAALARGDRFFQVEYRYRRSDDGRVVWLLLRAEIRLDATGKPEKVVGVLLDITDRKRAEEALLDSQARLALATEAAELGIWDWDVITNRMIYSDRARAIYGLPPHGEVSFEMVGDATHPVDRIRTSAMARRALDPAVRAKEPYEYRVVWPDGSIRWVLAHGEAVFGTVDGQEKALRYVGTIQDITGSKRSEAHQRLLINELNHRVKNTLATVQSIAAQSFRNVEVSGDPTLLAGARKAFEERLFALARAHDILTRENWEGAGLRDIVTDIIAPHRRGQAGHDPFVVDGPDLRLSPAMALSLAMALHELCTNAAKYGALRQAGGSVRIVWTEEPQDGRRQLKLTWFERGGPPVIPPTHKGFGTRLLERGLAYELGGAVRLTYDPSGLVCTIAVPLD